MLAQLKEGIEKMEKTVSEQQAKLAEDTKEMNELLKQMEEIKAKYTSKQIEVATLSKKINEKIKILDESRKAYNKVRNIIFIPTDRSLKTQQN